MNPPLPLLPFLSAAVEVEAQAGRVEGVGAGTGTGADTGTGTDTGTGAGTGTGTGAGTGTDGGQSQGASSVPGAVGVAGVVGVDIVEKLAADAVTLLLQKAPLLDEYFGIKLCPESGTLLSLPMLVSGYTPQPSGLASFLLSLATAVEWGEETACFRTIALAVGEYYSTLPTEFPIQLCLEAHNRAGADVATAAARARAVGAGAGAETGADAAGATGTRAAVGAGVGAVGVGVGATAFPQLTPQGAQTLSSLLYPALRAYLLPHVRRTEDSTVVQIANLDHLYKAFERC
jgi:hypothetical protein